MKWRKLGRTPKHRRALFRNLCTSLMTHERIVTTQHKAFEMRPWIEKLIRKAMLRSYQGNKFVGATLFTKTSIDKLNKEIAPRYRDQGLKGGFTRVVMTGRRENDRAKMATIELVNNPMYLYEQRERANELESLGKPSVWEWELKILRQE